MSTAVSPRPHRAGAQAPEQTPGRPHWGGVPPEALPARRWSRPKLPAGWPLTALFMLYPLWWAMGLPTFIFAILAVPMGFELIRRKKVKVPPGFGIWLVLLIWVLMSGLMLNETPSETLPPTGSGRYIGFTVRAVNYIALTVIMLYVLNLKEREISRRRLVRMFGFMCLVTVTGGYLGMLFPHLSFIAPLAKILPHSIASDPFVSRLMHVEMAQVQDVLEGEAGQPRPSAPFEYTNTWGENICVLLIFLVAGWCVMGGQLRRIAGCAVVLAAFVPIIYSLNRGLWIGIGISALYVAIRLALRGRVLALGGLAAAAGLVGLLIIASPLGNEINKRLDNGHSDDIRARLNAAAIQSAKESPIFGYGANRALLGSGRSMAIGKSADCPQCGNREIGSDGQLWHLLIAQGFVGAAAYNLFFLWNIWRFRHDHSPIGIAGSLVLVLMLFFQFVYGALNSTLAFALITVALLARNEEALRRKRAAALAERVAA